MLINGVLDLQSIKKYKPKFWLCKPNRQVVHPLKDIYNSQLQLVKGEVPTLSFSFPSAVLRNGDFVKNPLLEKLKGHMLVKMSLDGIVSYFTIAKQGKSFPDESVNVTCYLEAHELSKRYLRGIDETSKSLRYLTTVMLEETPWEVDYIDGDVELLYRSYEADSTTILQGLFDLAEKFNCVIEFNSDERKISFKKYENIGINKGIKLKEGKSLESFNLEISDEDIVTRLVAYGQDGLEFRSLTPNGVNYIQDFSWFMYPFECDENYNVIKKSNYMSDELCIALIKYQELLQTVGNSFETLKNNRTTTLSQITVAKQQLATLENDMKVINNTIDMLNATYQDNAPSQTEHIQAVQQKNNKQIEINAKTSEIESLEETLDEIDQDIRDLQITISATENFTREELDELSKFIFEAEYSNDSIIDEQDLLDEAMLVFEDYRQPPLSLTIDIEAFADYFDTKLIKMIGLGDTISLKSKTMNVDVKAHIHGITYSFDDFDVQLNITNIKEVLSDEEIIAKTINTTSVTSTTVNLNKYKWKSGENANTLVNQILQGEYDTAKNVLLGGTNNSVSITERGLYNRDVNDSNTYMVINNGILAITPDNGNTVSVAISKNGVHADKVVGKLLMGNQLVIESDSGILESNGATTTIYNDLGIKKVELGEYSNPNNLSQKKYGLHIIDGAIDIRTSTTLNRGVQFDSDGFRSFNNNGVRTFNVDAVTGVVSIVGSMNIKTSATTNRGVQFDGNGISAYNASGTRTFYVDTNGVVTAIGVNITGTINATGGTISGNLTVTGSLSGGVISGASINGGSITGAIFQTTSANNSGIKINSSGLSAYNYYGTRTFNIDTSTGNVSINGGSITGATSLNITEDAYIGNNIYLGRFRGGTKSIKFNETATIYSGSPNSDSLVISAQYLTLGSRSIFEGSVDFSSATSIVWGSHTPSARFG